MFILGSFEARSELFLLGVIRLSRYEEKEMENRRFRSNAVTLIQYFR